MSVSEHDDWCWIACPHDSPPTAGPEVIHAIRRTDGELVFGEYSFLVVAGESDWTPAEDDTEWANDPTEYEMVRMTVEVVERRTFPSCRECDQPAAHWGLCEHHAREDDPEAFADATAEPPQGGSPPTP